MEKQSGCKIKTLRFDNGKEYTTGRFQQFYDESGIEHQLIAPYTPQKIITEFLTILF